MQDTEHKVTYGVQNPLPVSIVVVVYVLYCIQIPITSVPWEEKRGKVSSNSILGFLFCFIFIFNEALLQYDTRRCVRHVQICQTYKWVFMIKQFKHYLGMQ